MVRHQLLRQRTEAQKKKAVVEFEKRRNKRSDVIYQNISCLNPREWMKVWINYESFENNFSIPYCFPGSLVSHAYRRLLFRSVYHMLNVVAVCWMPAFDRRLIWFFINYPHRRSACSRPLFSPSVHSSLWTMLINNSVVLTLFRSTLPSNDSCSYIYGIEGFRLSSFSFFLLFLPIPLERFYIHIEKHSNLYRYKGFLIIYCF